MYDRSWINYFAFNFQNFSDALRIFLPRGHKTPCRPKVREVFDKNNIRIIRRIELLNKCDCAKCPMDFSHNEEKSAVKRCQVIFGRISKYHQALAALMWHGFDRHLDLRMFSNVCYVPCMKKKCLLWIAGKFYSTICIWLGLPVWFTPQHEYSNRAGPQRWTKHVPTGRKYSIHRFVFNNKN